MGIASHWVKKIHMYTGLLNLSILLVFGLSGLVATVDPGPSDRPPLQPAKKEDVAFNRPAGDTREFRIPPNTSDFEAAMAAFEFLDLPLVGPPAKGQVRRDREGNVAFDLYSMNGPHHITLLEKENRIRIETRRNILPRFIDNLHTTTIGTGSRDLRVHMWSWYNEVAIWSLIFMAASGVWLWISSRPDYLWARISFAAGSGAFLLLYFLTR